MKEQIQKEFAVIQAEFAKGIRSLHDKYSKDYVMIIRNNAGQSCNSDLRLEVKTTDEYAEAIKLYNEGGCTGSCVENHICDC